MTERTERAPVLDQLEGQWHKLAAALLYKLARDKPVIISYKDLQEFELYMLEGDKQLLTWGHYDSIEFRLVTRADAERIAAQLETTVGRGRA